MSEFKPIKRDRAQLLRRSRPESQDESSPENRYAVFNSNQFGFTVYVRFSTLYRIFLDSESEQNEIYGLLAGRPFIDTQGTWLVITEIMSATSEEIDSSPARFQIRAENLAHIRRRLEKQYETTEPVGWYHSHKEGDALYSEDDKDEQGKWPEIYHVGIVVSYHALRSKVSVYHGPKSTKMEALNLKEFFHFANITYSNRSLLPPPHLPEQHPRQPSTPLPNEANDVFKPLNKRGTTNEEDVGEEKPPFARLQVEPETRHSRSGIIGFIHSLFNNNLYLVLVALLLFTLSGFFFGNLLLNRTDNLAVTPDNVLSAEAATMEIISSPAAYRTVSPTNELIVPTAQIDQQISTETISPPSAVAEPTMLPEVAFDQGDISADKLFGGTLYCYDEIIDWYSVDEGGIYEPFIAPNVTEDSNIYLGVDGQTIQIICGTQHEERLLLASFNNGINAYSGNILARTQLFSECAQEVLPPGWISYEIRQGETFTRIMATHFGEETTNSQSFENEIIRYSCIEDPNQITAGNLIYLPPR